MEALFAILWEFAKTHLATEHNIYMGLTTYGIIWASELPVRKAIERLSKRKQFVWWERISTWKTYAAIFWCEIFVWIPTSQPELCNGQTHGCQTVPGRIMLGILLGVLLSLLHKYFLARIKRALGVHTKEPREVTLARK